MKKNLILICALFFIIASFSFSQQVNESAKDSDVVFIDNNLGISIPKGTYAFDKKVAEKEFNQKIKDNVKVNNYTPSDLVVSIYYYGLDEKWHITGTSEVDSNDDESIDCTIEDNLKKYRYFAIKIRDDVDVTNYEVSVSVHNHDLVFNIAEKF